MKKVCINMIEKFLWITETGHKGAVDNFIEGTVLDKVYLMVIVKLYKHIQSLYFICLQIILNLRKSSY